MRMRILFVDFPSESLLRELRRYNCETANLLRDESVEQLSTAQFSHLLSRVSADCDIVYYTKFVSRGLEDFPPYVSGIKCKSILGFHAPTLVPHPDRTLYKLYNLISLARLVIHKSVGVFDAFHSLNRFDHATLSAMGFRTFLIPMGFDEDLFRPCEKSQEEFRVVFTGSLYHKGADIAAKLAHALGRKHNDIRFLFVNGAKRAFMDNALDYREFLAKSSAGNIETMDLVDQEQFAQLLGHSHLLLFPSRWESFGRVTVEALGCGCPVVCFDIAGPPRKLITNSEIGCVAEPFNVNELTRGVLRFYNLWRNRFDAYMELNERCRQLSLMFSWKNLAPKYLEMFKIVSGVDEPS